MFELPDIDLNEIEIPVEEFDSVSDITEAQISKLIDTVKNNLTDISNKTNLELVKRVKKEIENFSESVALRLLSLTYGPSLQSEGTHFIITNVNEVLASDIEEDVTTQKKNEATNLQRHLLGFSNTMQKGEKAPIITKFRDHKDNRVISLVGPDEFFTQDDYKTADHHIEGEFDAFGNFKGTISVYHQEPKDLVFNLNLSGQKIACGAFTINFAYTQGKRSESQVPFEKWAELTNKLNAFGGIYVYKNGIRVLPYGNSDYDFLEVERRRSLHAGNAYFSYRRMIGSIDLKSPNNDSLQEKAGREGFQSNKAYRQFREYLMKFLEAVAFKHFSTDGAYATEWLEAKTELEKEHLATQKRRKTVTSKKKEFNDQLDNFFTRIEADQVYEGFFEICDIAKNRLNSLLDDFELDEVATEIIDLELLTNSKLKEHFDSFVITKPRAVGLTKEMSRDWIAYQNTINEKITPNYLSAREDVDSAIGELSKKAKIHLDTRARLIASINSSREYNFKLVADQRKGAEKALEGAETYVNDQLKTARRELEQIKSKIEEEIISADFEEMDDDKFDIFRTSLELQLENNSVQLKDKLESIKNQLLSVPQDSDEAILSNDNAVAALETELETLKDDYNSSLEMAQLGMAVSVIHHEFEANIKGVRNSIRELQRWANKNEAIKELYVNMRDGFDHLDNYLSLFTPLDRRLRKRKTKVTGEAIADFIKDLFSERLERHNIKLKVKDKFTSQSLSTFASVVYPVFVNVIDNAIHWLSQKDGSREITLGATKTGFTITDNGPGISSRDLPHIFEFGYTRKHGGRGMGLYIAKSSLNKDNLDITVSRSHKVGTKFYIKPLVDKS